MEINIKKIVIGFVFLVFAVFLILSLIGFLSPKEEDIILFENSNKFEEEKDGSEIVLDENLDFDNDGLVDKLEKAIGTSFEKNDTDEDGFEDLEEIKNGYSPLVAGAEGKLSEEDFSALKEKIKIVDAVFYEKIFSNQEKPIVSSAPETLSSSVLSPVAVDLSGPAVFKEEVSLSNKNWKYAFYAPANLDMNKKQTLLIGLHGFGGKAAEYIKFWQSDADKGGFLVVVLQDYSKIYPSGSTVVSYPWLEISDFTKAAIADVEKKYKIGYGKIFLTGYSAGASSAYIVALDSGIKFRGVIPIGGYLPLDAGILDKLSKAKDVNFYVVHGADDVGVDSTITQEKILLQYGAKMEFKTLQGVSHGYPAAEHENILKWMEGLQ